MGSAPPNVRATILRYRPAWSARNGTAVLLLGAVMNYYTRTQQVLAFNARQSAARMAYFEGLRGLGQSTAGVPAGSRLSYTVTWGSAATSPGWNDPKAVIQAISSTLNNTWGIRVTSENHHAGMGVL